MFMMKSRESGYVEGNDPKGKVLSMCHLNYWYPGQVGRRECGQAALVLRAAFFISARILTQKAT